jgi:hypothetical protein
MEKFTRIRLRNFDLGIVNHRGIDPDGNAALCMQDGQIVKDKISQPFTRSNRKEFTDERTI